jgi:hypothetical protein
VPVGTPRSLIANLTRESARPTGKCGTSACGNGFGLRHCLPGSRSSDRFLLATASSVSTAYARAVSVFLQRAFRQALFPASGRVLRALPIDSERGRNVRVFRFDRGAFLLKALASYFTDREGFFVPSASRRRFAKSSCRAKDRLVLAAPARSARGPSPSSRLTQESPNLRRIAIRTGPDLALRQASGVASPFDSAIH